MPDPSAPAIHIRNVQKDYHALRPLRVRELDVLEGESIALLGFDRAAAEVFVNLLTAATVPDTGRIEIFGRPTVDIQDATTWLLVRRWYLFSGRKAKEVVALVEGERVEDTYLRSRQLPRASGRPAGSRPATDCC